MVLVTEKLKVLIADIMEFDESIEDDANLVNDLGMASIDFVELAVAIEKKFGVPVPIEVFSQVATVRSLSGWITERLAQVEQTSAS